MFSVLFYVYFIILYYSMSFYIICMFLSNPCYFKLSVLFDVILCYMCIYVLTVLICSICVILSYQGYSKFFVLFYVICIILLLCVILSFYVLCDFFSFYMWPRCLYYCMLFCGFESSHG